MLRTLKFRIDDTASCMEALQILNDNKDHLETLHFFPGPWATLCYFLVRFPKMPNLKEIKFQEFEILGLAAAHLRTLVRQLAINQPVLRTIDLSEDHRPFASQEKESIADHFKATMNKWNVLIPGQNSDDPPLYEEL